MYLHTCEPLPGTKDFMDKLPTMGGVWVIIFGHFLIKKFMTQVFTEAKRRVHVYGLQYTVQVCNTVHTPYTMQLFKRHTSV